jgi:hypothetical protein
MVHPLILKKHGTTRERLRQIFERREMKDPGPDASEQEREEYKRFLADAEVRKAIEAEIQERLEESVSWGVQNYQFYAAVDIAWDTTAVSKVLMPLLMYAQGKIKLDACAQQLSTIPGTESYISKDKDGKPLSINLPKFAETAINVVRSIVTRRHAAQSVKYSNLYPYYKYESRSTGQVGKCKADVMSQQAEVVVDGFGYRHHDSQVMRDGFLYGHSIDFISSAWEVHRTEVIDKTAEAFNTFASAGKEADLNLLPTKSVIYKEGLSWTNPHPTRLIIDDNYPLPAINDDCGPEFIGYWDIVRYSDIADNPLYFNTKAVSYGEKLWSLYSTYNTYFTQYYDRITTPTAPLIPGADSSAPPNGAFAHTDLANNNDRKANVGIYTSENGNAGTFKAEYFRKLKPSDYGIGTYAYPIWIRFVVAGDSTVVYAEPIYSKPAAALSINENDSRKLNASFAHDVMWAQDMMSNLISQMMVAVQGELLKIIAINKDVVDDADYKKIEKILQGREFAASGPIVIPVSLQKMSVEMDIKLDALFKIGETQQSQSVETIIRAMGQLMNLLERLASMSPAEQGQPAPREISATEVTEMASTTQNVYAFISDAVDEYRSAKKRILYETMIGAMRGKVQVPVLGRYSRGTIEKAGFKAAAGGVDEVALTDRPASVNVVGDSSSLSHDYIFTTRDGSERPVNTQAANTMVQLMQAILQVPEVREKLGREKIYEMFNEIFRLSGTGADLNLEVQEGEEGGFGEDQIAAMGQLLEQLKTALQEIASATQQNAAAISEQEQTNEKQESVLQGLMESLDLVKKTATDIEKLTGRMTKLEQAPEVPEVRYQDSPEEIKRQIEQRNGFSAPADPTYLEMELAKKKETKKSVAGLI